MFCIQWKKLLRPEKKSSHQELTKKQGLGLHMPRQLFPFLVFLGFSLMDLSLRKYRKSNHWSFLHSLLKAGILEAAPWVLLVGTTFLSSIVVLQMSLPNTLFRFCPTSILLMFQVRTQKISVFLKISRKKW